MTPNEARAKLAEIIQEAGADISFGLFQQTVAFADEGDHTNTPENIAFVRSLYFDPAHACDVAADKFKHWRYDPEVSALQAWCAYNLPISYNRWPDVPNVEQRENYRAGLAEAQAILGAPQMTGPLVYNPDAPVDIQLDSWSCSEQSAQWLLRALGRNPGDAWIRDQLLTNGLVTKEYGLMDASGASLAAWLQKEYGDEMGLRFTSKNGASWEDIAAIAGKQPLMLGGRSWNHWTGVRRMTDAGLELANPAPNWQSVGPVLDRAEWERWGSWSYITVSDGAVAAPLPPPAPEPPPAPPPPVDPKDARITELEAALAAEQEKVAGFVNAVAYLGDDLGDRLQGVVDELRRVRAQFVGPKP